MAALCEFTQDAMVVDVVQVQAENVQQAETLVKLVQKVEGLNSDVQDTQQLIGALHGALWSPSILERHPHKLTVTLASL